jgi:hypothetical protein
MRSLLRALRSSTSLGAALDWNMLVTASIS